MSFYTPNVRKHLHQSNSVTSWGTGGIAVSQPLQQTGILAGLRAITSAQSTATVGTGTLAVDKLGPWNTYSQHTLSFNGGTPSVSVSGYGLFLANLIKKSERGAGSFDAVVLAESNAGALSDVFNTPDTTTTNWRFAQDLPIVQRIAGMGDVGFVVLGNSGLVLNYSATPNTASANPGPYNLFSLTAGQAPYLATGNATYTVSSPVIDLVRDMFEVPASPQDMPSALGSQLFVPSWLEEAPQGITVGGASSIPWALTPNSGILVRLLAFAYDGNTSDGIASSSLSTANAVSLTYNNQTPIFIESAYESMARQLHFYGFALPQGVFSFDFMGHDLMLSDSIDSSLVPNVKLTLNPNVAMGTTNSFVKVIREMLSPLIVG